MGGCGLVKSLAVNVLVETLARVARMGQPEVHEARDGATMSVGKELAALMSSVARKLVTRAAMTVHMAGG